MILVHVAGAHQQATRIFFYGICKMNDVLCMMLSVRVNGDGVIKTLCQGRLESCPQRNSLTAILLEGNKLNPRKPVFKCPQNIFCLIVTAIINNNNVLRKQQYILN